jgi:hypothetical protein
MRSSLPSSFAKTVVISIATILAITLLAGSAAAQAVGFTTQPPLGRYTLQGCRNDGTISLPSTSNAYGTSLFVCPDAAYTGGNLGKGWNELDLVPFRLTTSTDSKDTTTTYNLIIAGEYSNSGHLGWDVIGSDAEVLNTGSTTVGSSTFSTQPGPTPEEIQDERG